MIVRENDVVSGVSSYFSSDHWLRFVKELERGSEVRHAHIYVDSCLTPYGVGKIIETFFERRGTPLCRSIRYLPITPDTLNIYNITPKGMCHFEMFLHYNPDVILAPMPDEFSREGQPSSFWDDAYMREFYRQFDFKPITEEAEKEIEEYFYGDDFRYAYRMMIDDNRGIIHSHAVIETCIHPEQLIPYAVKSFQEMHVDVQKTVSVVFNCCKKDIPKMIFLLGGPEVCVEVEWHYNPRVAIKPAAPGFYRIIDEKMMREYEPLRDRYALSKENIKEILSII